MAAWWPHGSKVEMILPTGPKLAHCSRVQPSGALSKHRIHFLRFMYHPTCLNNKHIRNRRADVMFESKEPLGDLMQASLCPVIRELRDEPILP